MGAGVTSYDRFCGWRDGYHTGQADLLTRLEGNVPPDEDPLAPVSERHARRYALWCLVHNLEVAAALCSGRLHPVLT